MGRTKTITAWAACLIIIAGLAGCKGLTEKRRVDKARPVKAMTINAGPWIEQYRYPGKVRANRKVDLSFRVEGPLIQLAVKTGQAVKKGEVLARIDPRDFAFTLERARAAFVEAQSQFARYESLLAKKAVARSVYDSRQRAFLEARAAFHQAKAALSDTYLKAPFAGVVAKTYVEGHQEVKAKQPIVSLQSLDRLEIVISIPEKDVLLKSRSGAFRHQVSLDALPGRLFSATLKEYSTEADPVTQTFTCVFTIKRPADLNLLPGMTAQLNAWRVTPGREGSNCYMVPVEAVLAGAEKTGFVWKIPPKTMRVVRVPVTVGAMRGDCITLLSGVKDGDTIATAGVHYLRAGMKVKLMGGEKGRCTE